MKKALKQNKIKILNFSINLVAAFIAADLHAICMN